MTKKPINLNILVIFIIAIWSVNPGYGQTVMKELKAHNQTSEFAKAIQKTDLKEKLKNRGPFTLLVPSTKAFNNLSGRQQTDTSILLNHILTGMATERSLRVMSDVTCLSGKTLIIENKDGLTINTYSIVRSNIRAENGVIHIIDGVIK